MTQTAYHRRVIGVLRPWTHAVIPNVTRGRGLAATATFRLIMACPLSR
jgi:hypothetical protein